MERYYENMFGELHAVISHECFLSKNILISMRQGLVIYACNLVISKQA